jgi:hypothetical protein
MKARKSEHDKWHMQKHCGRFFPGPFDNPIGSELAQPRTNIADWYTQVFGNFLCREAVGAAPQDLEDAIRKFRHYNSLNLPPLQQGY